jgi:hypothetical protein
MMKGQARHFVYSERAKSSGNLALQNMVWLEEEILRLTESEWRETIACWRGCSIYERQALDAILIRAKDRARREVVMDFDDRITEEALLRFFESFEPGGIIPSEGAS